MCVNHRLGVTECVLTRWLASNPLWKHQENISNAFRSLFHSKVSRYSTKRLTSWCATILSIGFRSSPKIKRIHERLDTFPALRREVIRSLPSKRKKRLLRSWSVSSYFVLDYPFLRKNILLSLTLTYIVYRVMNYQIGSSSHWWRN